MKIVMKQRCRWELLRYVCQDPSSAIFQIVSPMKESYLCPSWTLKTILAFSRERECCNLLHHQRCEWIIFRSCHRNRRRKPMHGLLAPCWLEGSYRTVLVRRSRWCNIINGKSGSSRWKSGCVDVFFTTKDTIVVMVASCQKEEVFF